MLCGGYSYFMMREFPYDFPKENMFKIDNVSPNKSRIELKSFVFFNIVLLYTLHGKLDTIKFCTLNMFYTYTYIATYCGAVL